jgi:hypothetical protein
MGLFMFMQRIALAAVSAMALVAAGSAQAATLTLNLTADNAFSAYLSDNDSTLGTLIGSGNDWTTTYSFTTSVTGAGAHFLHIVAVNGGGPEMFIGSFSLNDPSFHFANGGQSLDTDVADWRAIPITDPSTWVQPAAAPLTFGLNGVGPWGIRPGISSSAAFIWSNPENGFAADLSTTINGPAVSGVPEPSSWAVMLLGLFATGALLRASRRRAVAGA